MNFVAFKKIEELHIEELLTAQFYKISGNNTTKKIINKFGLLEDEMSKVTDKI